MVERFNVVARRGILDFEAWFSARTEPGRSWEVDEEAWEFSYRYLPALRIGGRVLSVPGSALQKELPDVVVSLYASASFLAGWAIARQRGARTAFWVEATFDAWIKRRRWKEALKSAVLPRADAVLTPGDDARAFAMRYGVPAERILFIPNVIDYGRYERASSISAVERDAIRRDLHVRGDVFMYVGRLWSGKGLEYLVEAFAGLQRETSGEVSLLLVGDGPDEGRLRLQCEQLGAINVVFSGYQAADLLPRTFAAADVFVFPTLGDPFGMVVTEAMACGLPVIATTSSGEIADRVREGENGFIVPPANADALKDRMARLAADAALRERMAAAARRSVAGQSPEVWAQHFEDAVRHILTMPPRRRSSRGR
jgi:glycosyltransferase involved in cell wall biosynthesis